jgi:thiamine-monophosphate kinase
VAATGSVERGKAVLRAGGKVGDEIWVTGKLGGSLAGKHLSFTPRVEEAKWLVEHFKPTAMMDLSDGLAKDLGRMALASGCGFKLETELLPLTDGCSVAAALGDGEDFELLLAAPVGMDVAGWLERFPHLELTRIGVLVEQGEGDDLAGGWDHFA